ncbi:MAG: hypothetical protein SGJ04_06350 [Bacteroidota bacterium]|nr:hypothetical protein [Bacteroidota bacterium]
MEDDFNSLKSEINGELEIAQDAKFQQREWQIEKLVWSLSALVLLAGALGLFGRGLLSYRTETTNKGTEINYAKLLRYQTEEEFSVTFKDVSVKDKIWISIDDESLKKLGISASNPTPNKVIAVANAKRFEYLANDTNFIISFKMRPNISWSSILRLKTFKGDEPNLSQFIYP